MTATLYYSNNPPVKNEAFTYYFSVISQSDTDIFQSNPTFASGDSTTEGDGNTPANCTNLPSAINSGKVLSHTLTADEMNNNTVYVLHSDASGAEWQDALIVIYTVTAATVASSDPPSAATITDAVWDEAQSGHTSAGTFGKYLDDEISDVDTNVWAATTRTLTTYAATSASASSNLPVARKYALQK